MESFDVPNYVSIPICTVASLFMLRKMREFSWGWVRSARDMTGKCVVITGANSGLGEATARELAKRNARVILACRDERKAEEAAKRIRKYTPNGQLIPMHVDLRSLQSVRQFAAEFREAEPRLDVLICNAGVSIPPERKERSEDGLEIHFAVNHLAHFLLVRELTPILESSSPSRVVIVASSLYKGGKAMFNAEKLESSDSRPGVRNSLYSDSKLGNVLFTRQLAKEMEGSGVTVYAVCPGWCHTGLFRHSMHNFSLARKIAMFPILFWFMRYPEQGCQVIVHCAIDETLEKETGKMYKDLVEMPYNDYAKDDKLAKDFWNYSQDLVDACKPL